MMGTMPIRGPTLGHDQRRREWDAGKTQEWLSTVAREMESLAVSLQVTPGDERGYASDEREAGPSLDAMARRSEERITADAVRRQDKRPATPPGRHGLYSGHAAVRGSSSDSQRGSADEGQTSMSMVEKQRRSRQKSVDACVEYVGRPQRIPVAKNIFQTWKEYAGIEIVWQDLIEFVNMCSAYLTQLPDPNITQNVLYFANPYLVCFS